jgi:ABC-type phosphate transport system substrate-binding protein
VNWPSFTVFAGTPVANRQAVMNAINGAAQPVFGQVFGFSVNKGASSPAYFSATQYPVLSRSAIAGIFNGSYDNWNQVPVPGGGYVTNADHPIAVIRREQGSGTQVAGHQFLLGVSQCVSSIAPANGAMVTGPSVTSSSTPVGAGVWETSSSSTLNALVNISTNAIGVRSLDADPSSNTAYIAIDGVQPGALPREKGATGEYDFWYELTFTPETGLAADIAATELAIRTLARSQIAAPNNDHVIALPVGSNDPFSQDAFSSAKAPVAFFTRNKNTCGELSAISPL